MGVEIHRRPLCWVFAFRISTLTLRRFALGRKEQLLFHFLFQPVQSLHELWKTLEDGDRAQPGAVVEGR